MLQLRPSAAREKQTAKAPHGSQTNQLAITRLQVTGHIAPLSSERIPPSLSNHIHQGLVAGERWYSGECLAKYGTATRRSARRCGSKRMVSETPVTTLYLHLLTELTFTFPQCTCYC